MAKERFFLQMCKGSGAEVACFGLIWQDLDDFWSGVWRLRATALRMQIVWRCICIWYAVAIAICTGRLFHRERGKVKSAFPCATQTRKGTAAPAVTPSEFVRLAILMKNLLALGLGWGGTWPSSAAVRRCKGRFFSAHRHLFSSFFRSPTPFSPHFQPETPFSARKTRKG